MRYLILTFIIIIGCKTNNPSIPSDDNSIYENIADTIIYDVLIKNPELDDSWASECIKSLDRIRLIDQIFEDIYEKRYPAIDYFTGKRISIAEIKKMEKSEEILRDNIGKIQFQEGWKYNLQTHLYQKTVFSITLGQEIRGQDGHVRGYKSLFKIKYQ